MRLYIISVLSTALLAVAAAPQGGGSQDVLKKLEGTWSMVSGEEKGKALSEETVKKSNLTIVGDKHTVIVGSDTIVGTHKVNPAAKLPTIESAETAGPNKGQTILGIYRLEGDVFTVCFAAPGKDRPTEFATKSGTGELVHVWKLQKK